MTIDPEREYSPKEAGDLIRRSANTVRRAIRSGFLYARNDGTATQSYFMIKGRDLIEYDRRRRYEDT